MRISLLFIILLTLGCDQPPIESPDTVVNSNNSLDISQKTLPEARAEFVTKIVSQGESYGAPDSPPGMDFKLIHYPSEVGPLAAYLTSDPTDGKQHPAIVWITGGDNNTIGDVWSPQSRDNDQSARAFRKAGVVMMFPSQRGGNDNPGQREGFLGEVDDILSATDHLASLPYVDPKQIYLGGHSTGGTLAMLVGECTDRYRAIFAIGPVADVSQYGGNYVYCDPNDDSELLLRSPLYWMHGVKSPLYVIEGELGNWDGSIEIMARENNNKNIRFYRLTKQNHFNIIAPVTELLAKQVADERIDLTQVKLNKLFEENLPID